MVLDAPDRLGQTLHDLVLDSMWVAEAGEQTLITIADTAWLVDAELFEDGQMQPQMEKGIGLSKLGWKVLIERALAVFQERKIFGMTMHDLDEL